MKNFSQIQKQTSRLGVVTGDNGIKSIQRVEKEVRVYLRLESSQFGMECKSLGLELSPALDMLFDDLAKAGEGKKIFVPVPALSAPESEKQHAPISVGETQRQSGLRPRS